MIRLMTLLMALGVVSLLTLAVPASATAAEGDGPAVLGNVDAVAGSIQAELDSQKRKGKHAKKKGVKKKVIKKNTRGKGFPKWGLGVRIGVIPFNDMDVTRNDMKGLTDYDHEAIWGFGINGEYRFHKKWSAAAEFAYYFPQVDNDPDNHPCDKPDKTDHDCAFTESDGLLNIGVGTRFDFMGNGHSKSRVYGKFMFGVSAYIADDANDDADNRTGIYVNPVVGFEQLFVPTFGLFVETGYYHTWFWGADREDRAALNGWSIGAGFNGHF